MLIYPRIARNLALTATGIALAVSTFTAKTQSWETILDLQDANSADARGRTLLVDPYSSQLAPFRLFVGGHIASQAAMLVYDQGTGTSNRYDVAEAFRVNQIGVDPSSGNLFAAMLSYAVPNGRWQVSKSTDGGMNWTVVDTFVLSTNQSAIAWSFAADGAGNLFVAGRADDSAGQNHWVVRASTNHGQSWTTVDNLLNAIPRRMYSVPGTNGGLFVVGTRYVGSWWTWTVRRSRDCGTTWSTVDSGPQPVVDHGYANGVRQCQ